MIKDILLRIKHLFTGHDYDIRTRTFEDLCSSDMCRDKIEHDYVYYTYSYKVEEYKIKECPCGKKKEKLVDVRWERETEKIPRNINHPLARKGVRRSDYL